MKIHRAHIPQNWTAVIGEENPKHFSKEVIKRQEVQYIKGTVCVVFSETCVFGRMKRDGKEAALSNVLIAMTATYVCKPTSML